MLCKPFDNLGNVVCVILIDLYVYYYGYLCTCVLRNFNPNFYDDMGIGIILVIRELRS